jgi:predicted  nucleic acid-binding Zn-ribbon protein
MARTAELEGEMRIIKQARSTMQEQFTIMKERAEKAEAELKEALKTITKLEKKLAKIP